MTELLSVVEEFARNAQDVVGRRKKLPADYDYSSGDQCLALTHTMMSSFMARGLPIRRELHFDSRGFWHYLLAHQYPDEKPTSHDLVTDVNPWQFQEQGLGFFHTGRDEVIARLRAAQAPETFVALRSLRTIVEPHDPSSQLGVKYLRRPKGPI